MMNNLLDIDEHASLVASTKALLSSVSRSLEKLTLAYDKIKADQEERLKKEQEEDILRRSMLWAEFQEECKKAEEELPMQIFIGNPLQYMTFEQEVASMNHLSNMLSH